MGDPLAQPAAPWHALLAPPPAEARPRRQPVASPEVLESPHGSAITGWEQLTVELSAGAAGLRHIMVVLDAAGRPISAGDTVLYRCEPTTASIDSGEGAARAIECFHESVGGRLEVDGTFRGTRWFTVSREPSDGSEPTMQSTPSEPTEAEVAAVKALVADVLRRIPVP